MARTFRVAALLRPVRRAPRGRHAAPPTGPFAAGPLGPLARRVTAVVPALALAASGLALAATTGSEASQAAGAQVSALRVPDVVQDGGASPAYPSAGPAPAPMQLPPVYDTFTSEWQRVDVAWTARPVQTVLAALAPVRLDANGIPEVALGAYHSAADRLRAVVPSCGLDWALLGAIGRVESNHARFGGNLLDRRGVARPGIIGIPLDGRPGTARILDTDRGQWDRDDVYDRAVGPMQFIPGTWRGVAVDGDGDGVTDPQNMVDAAASAGAYLCSGHTDLRSEDGARRAVLRYNHSDDYARTVLSIADAYRRGVTIVPVGALPAARPAAGTGSATPAGSGFAWGGSDAPDEQSGADRPSASSDGPKPRSTQTPSPSRPPSAAPSPTPSPSPSRRSEPQPVLPQPRVPVPSVPLPKLPVLSVPLPTSAVPLPTVPAEIAKLLALPHLPLLPGDPADLVRVLDPATLKVVCILDDRLVACPGGLLG
jgi:membrane-bound lytic murein transglycosylase B